MTTQTASKAEAEIVISTDPARFDLDRIHAWLEREAYWCKGLPRAVFDRSLRHSLCFGALTAAGEQAGFARIVTDRATFAYLCDVFVDPAFRKRGVSKALMDAVIAHPDLQGLRRFMLATADAGGLYARYGFQPLAQPGRFMEISVPNIYQRQMASA
ncbi:Acetyltransferase (GNAT) domain-containing protein [Rhizobiales bacterium GAS113]|jgi:GNAT superfamily N-acetyltransferase|nr:Acetyltransferase (GNAT) domain-containing protein [Rhizobiales bacterium GAS113]